ncbi:MAG: hypothetical protein IJX28_08540 [Clostridia bacterium]|nr:hypothetical protein [Clostridia bacterium]
MKTQNALNHLKNDAKYKQGRYALLLIAIFSIVNLFSVVLTETYYLFSSYITQFLAILGYTLYVETGAIVWVIVFGLLGLISVVPYLVCYFLSKKKVGWMIASLVLFSLDSLIFCVLELPYFDVSMLLDVVIRVWALVSLALGVKYGVALKDAPESEEPTLLNTDETAEAADDGQDELSFVERRITLTRAKSFVGCAIALSCIVDGKVVETIKNGETKTIRINGKACEFVVMSPNGDASEIMQIPAGYESRAYTVRCKTGMTSFRVILEETKEA